MKPALTIRPYRKNDFDAVAILWRIARERSLPDFQRAKGYFFVEDIEYFRDHIVPRNKLWVAKLDSTRVGYMAMQNDFVDQLYIHPDFWRRGIGAALLKHAKLLSPEHVWLFTLQVNMQARGFYEKHGFVAERLGVSPPPESEPDVEYHWRPGTG